MSTIGVGSAFRNQDREGRRQRARREKQMSDRRDQSHAGNWTTNDTRQLASCTTCGAEDEVGNLYHTGAGLSCPVCFSEGEDEIAAEPPASVKWLLVRAMPALLLPAPALGDLAGWIDLADLSFLIVLPWFMVFVALFFGSPWLLMNIASTAKEDYYRPGLEDHERMRLLIGHGWLATALVAGLTTTFWALAWTGPI